MIYSNIEYACLLIVTVFAFLMARKSYPARFVILTAASLLFYSWLSVVECVVFLFVVVVSWLFLALADTDRERKSWWIAAGITVMTLHLILWKYASWISTILYDHFPIAMQGKVLLFPLPAGISFFTLQGIAYLVDYGRGEVEMMPFQKYLLFKSFFPQLVAGPIVRARTMLPQINRLPLPENEDLCKGAILFSVGLAKKTLLADRIAPVIEGVFAHPKSFDRTSLVMAAVGFTIQLWADFSGYTDMGRGSARMLGIHLPENFLAPYFSRKPSEFWRRWHITLSTWIRDYIYFPLGGSRGTLLRVLGVSALTMVLSGLWHGAAFSYVLWGVYNGVWLAIERLMRGKWPLKFPAWFEIFCFYALFVLSMVVFRASSMQGMGEHFMGLIVGGPEKSSAEIFMPVLIGAFVMFAFHAVTYAPLDSQQRTLAQRIEALISFESPTVQVLTAAYMGVAVNLILFFRVSAEAFSFIYFKF